MILHITQAKYLRDFKIKVVFNDGLEKVVDLKQYIMAKKHPFFQPLKNIEEFKKFSLDKTLVWKSGADIAPEYLHNEIAPTLEHGSENNF